MSADDTADAPDDRDPLDNIREDEAAVEQIAERTDRLGAEARVLLALARDEQPDPTDLAATDLGDSDGTAGYERAILPRCAVVTARQVAATAARVLAAARRVERAEQGGETCRR